MDGPLLPKVDLPSSFAHQKIKALYFDLHGFVVPSSGALILGGSGTQ